VDAQGSPTHIYMKIREVIDSYLPRAKKLPAIPDPIPAIEISMIYPIKFTSLWDNLPQPVISENPNSFEAYGQDYGLILYQTVLNGHKEGKLTVTDIHDYATVFFNGEFIGTLDRREGIDTITLPATSVENPVLEILAEGMGRISSGQDLIDRKGITEKVTLNGVPLMNWKIYKFPMDKKFIYDLRSTGKVINKSGILFKGNFSMAFTGDTYFDVSGFTKGIVWVNGHNLGRYWNIGPQKRLYCPASFIWTGLNEIIIFDFLEKESKPVTGMTTIE